MSSIEIESLGQALEEINTVPTNPELGIELMDGFKPAQVQHRKSYAGADYGMYACNGILFNHESPIRGETFVTRKITRQLARIVVGLTDCLYLGNLNSLRDWGHARDYVQMQWLMLQQEKPRDFVIATGHQYSVRDFVNAAASVLGIEISWKGKDTDETGIIESINFDKLNLLLNKTDIRVNCKVGDTIVRVDPRYIRPTEVETLLGNPSLAKVKLNWAPSTTFGEMVDEMVKEDLRIAMKDKLVEDAGLRRK